MEYGAESEEGYSYQKVSGVFDPRISVVSRSVSSGENSSVQMTADTSSASAFLPESA